MKHKVLKEFPHLMENKKIIVLKVGTILNDYTYSNSNGYINIDKAIIDNNVEYFEVLDWKSELVVFLKNSKIPQPAILGKKLQPFIQDMFITNSPENTTKEILIDNPEQSRTIENLKKIIREKELDIEELNGIIERKESNISKALEEREKDLEFREEQLKKRKERLEDLDFEIENRTKEVKNKEFEVLTWENRVNQSISTLEDILKQSENIQTVIEQPQVQVAQEIVRQWDGVYRGVH